ncbi:4-hydroxybenzoate 3-monooxygenase [Virgisporangium ochraceum]|uniref:4-hydroxybenzoate 3-monooxygenase n=1 Tax=Virgisporangium ochraceum TaxID=65505 RepID=A0A8J3ZNM6_9ACTN|nr:4-hydroxybenzoate 3-monooxygenase [Virgisporangium ochraceum]GIJ67322.1 4-hydroxybenzoate 3-monooxygenase [Virgisporangium ochraceum]
MRTQVGIIGAGPAGLMLAHLLHRAGIESVVLENRSRDYVEKRVRAGVLEHPTVELLRETGLAERLDAQGLPHHGFALRFDGVDHRVALTELTGREITVYGQQEVVKDLIAARLAAGLALEFEVTGVSVHDLDSDRPRIAYTDSSGAARTLECDIIAGCDGFHGICRPAVADALTVFERVYPFAWLGVLAQTPPSHEELIYCYHDRGFALHSMRSPEVTRLYLQVPPDEPIERWPDDRIWEELGTRLAADGFTLTSGPIMEKGVTPMRSFVAEPMRHGRLFLAGDAAHIVPPTGAKGMNLAIADVRVLAAGAAAYFSTGRTELLDAYSDTCLRRVWRAEHFSWWMTSMLHRDPAGDPFDQRLQLSQLRYTAASRAALTSLAENYVGLPFDAPS